MPLSSLGLERIEAAIQPEEKLLKMDAGLASFYARQNAAISRTLARHRAEKPWAVDLAGDSVEEDAQNESRVAIPVNAAFVVNVLLLVLKLIAAGVSGSLAVVSSSIDSALDLLSGSIIFATTLIRKRRVPLLFPVGRTRLEPLSIIIFSSVMSTVALLLIREASDNIVTGLETAPPRVVIDGWTWGSLSASIVLKLLLLVLSRVLNVTSPSIKVLEVDHVNDMITNSFALVFIAIVEFQPDLWWLDPGVAIVLALYILYNWVLEGLEHVNAISGKAATPEQLSDLTRIALAHDRRILSICTVRAYTVGERLQVEIDIVLPADMDLKQAHDIGQTLQLSIENMDSVERCFVHLDTDLEDPHEEHVHPEALERNTSPILARSAAVAAADAVLHLQTPTASAEEDEEEGGASANGGGGGSSGAGAAAAAAAGGGGEQGGPEEESAAAQEESASTPKDEGDSHGSAEEQAGVVVTVDEPEPSASAELAHPEPAG